MNLLSLLLELTIADLILDIIWLKLLILEHLDGLRDFMILKYVSVKEIVLE
jgi:hypothetical protein